MGSVKRLYVQFERCSFRIVVYHATIAEHLIVPIHCPKLCCRVAPWKTNAKTQLWDPLSRKTVQQHAALVKREADKLVRMSHQLRFAELSRYTSSPPFTLPFFFHSRA
uniref:Uncharacterized protein n=1 Tax=Parascaris equorum TaxID=6256 RepID=A0A914R835_PAREQ